MFTECPACQTAFRVTANVLRESRGNVRCVDCGHAFDALDHLTEESPDGEAAESTSAERFDQDARELLKTLDTLTGSEDIRIEDTGVEWRVLDMDGDNDDDNEATHDNALPEEADPSVPAGQETETFSEATGDEAVDPDDARYSDDTPVPDADSLSESGRHRLATAPRQRLADTADDDALRVSIETGTEADWRELLDEVGGSGSPAATGVATTDLATADDETGDSDEPEYVPLSATPHAEAEHSALRPANAAHAVAEEQDDEDETLVETIVMEGDTVTDTLEFAERASYDDVPPPDLDSSSAVDLLPAPRRRRSRSGAAIGLGAALLLILALIAQFVHANRNVLAKHAPFLRAAAPLYEALGMPLTPMWDIQNWRFETTSGSTDEEESRLTVYSRVANKGPSALPYPLIHLSLTDRWDDVIGSRVLQPAQYLASDPGVPGQVPGGDAFVAVIAVADPAAAATGFKLNVCYPLAGGRLRCAIEDFRD